MSVVKVNLSDELLNRAQEIAHERASSLEQVIADAVRRMIESRDGMGKLAERAERGRNVNIKSILRKAPNVEPDADDRVD